MLEKVERVSTANTGFSASNTQQSAEAADRGGDAARRSIGAIGGYRCCWKGIDWRRPVEPDAVRAEIGEAGLADRAIRTAPGRPVSQPVGAPNFLIRDHEYSTSKQACAEAIPEQLPRQGETYHLRHECCPDCGGQLRLLGEDISEILECVPARFQVIRHVRPKLRCSGCERIAQ
jgi:hypothetical protein